MDYQRKGKDIKCLDTGAIINHKHFNEAKRKSRELQGEGHTMRVVTRFSATRK